nr:MAG TPA: MOSC N-terminal beta barrel domain [Caudoviricetes sp.]
MRIYGCLLNVHMYSLHTYCSLFNKELLIFSYKNRLYLHPIKGCPPLRLPITCSLRV